MTRIPVLFCLAVLPACLALAQTPIDVQPVKELKPSGSLATCGYTPSPKEKPFLKKLPSKELSTGSFMEPYDIRKKNKQLVSWFGVVRGIKRVQQSDNWELLLEQKYFDGMSDCHIMLVSMSGSGDFVARVQASDVPVPALALVRVYGTVRQGEGGLPFMEADFLRVFPWMTFTFTDLGAEDKGNPRWKKDCRICGRGRVYKAYPDERYYREALGEPSQYGLFLK